ncbi:response regulator [Aquimarina sp. MMG015]|uniref:response regulator n=1 Tax=Aquimarina sp. MMG015 TaxID=2822689 RepID=UPI001B39FC7D|nr:response regulator [Aquimarina sp. MMG015]MBQ4802794.1 response regulator [Aquimarina sp. MMG015]
MKNLKILLIEDDEIERMKFTRVLQKNSYTCKLQEATNGEEAVEILDDDTRTPDLILLDLNMPKMNGIEFLKSLKNNDKLKYIPVIILSTSNNHQDLKRCYEEGIAGYLVKPLKYEEYVEKIKSLIEYWGKNELISV